MQLGASLSHPHLRGLGIDSLRAIKEFRNLGLTWIRLGCYWNEMEKKEGQFTFDEISRLVEYCGTNNIKAVLTVGMKAPRYPEYYLPDWLSEKLKLKNGEVITSKNKTLLNATLKFIEKTVNHFRKSPAIEVWQVENEPLDPSGSNGWKIDFSFLQKEVFLVRKTDLRRKILINLWGNELSERGLYRDARKTADIVGLDLYLHQPGTGFAKASKYIGPSDTKDKIKKIIDEIKKHNKKVWIAELQAEPWEPDEIVTKKKNPPSFLPRHFKENINYGIDLNPDVVLLWGFEYWYWKKTNGDLRYWKEARNIIKKYQGL